MRSNDGVKHHGDNGRAAQTDIMTNSSFNSFLDAEQVRPEVSDENTSNTAGQSNIVFPSSVVAE